MIAMEEFRKRDFMKELNSKFGSNKDILRNKLHELAKTLLEQGHVDEAWKVLMSQDK